MDNIMVVKDMGPLLLTWFNINPNMDKNYIHFKVWDGVIYLFPNFNSATVEVWKWINNIMSHFTGLVITYQSWD